jgi:hypothetical protein
VVAGFLAGLGLTAAAVVAGGAAVVALAGGSTVVVVVEISGTGSVEGGASATSTRPVVSARPSPDEHEAERRAASSRAAPLDGRRRMAAEPNGPVPPDGGKPPRT